MRILFPFDIPRDHALRIHILHDGDGTIRKSEKARLKCRNAGWSRNIYGGIVEPTTRIGGIASVGCGDDQLANGFVMRIVNRKWECARKFTKDVVGKRSRGGTGWTKTKRQAKR